LRAILTAFLFNDLPRFRGQKRGNFDGKAAPKIEIFRKIFTEMKHKSSSREQSLIDRIADACDGLTYISETDAPIEAFANDELKEPTAKELLRSLGAIGEAVTESGNPDDFFQRLTRVRDWHTREQSKTVNRFKKLQQLLEKELDEIRVIRIGKIRIEIYVIGKSKTGEVVGVKTFAVET
jgi:hypothetical protein